MSYQENSYPSHFFQTDENILLISGLKVQGIRQNNFKKFIYYVYAVFLYSISLIFFFFEVIKLRDTIKYPTQFFCHIGLVFTHVMGILKVCLLLFGADKIEKIKKILQDETFRYDAFDFFQPGKMLENAKMKSSRVSMLVFFLYTIAGVSAFVSAWITISTTVKGEFFEGNVTCYDFLPFYFQIPFPAETKSQCEHAFIFMGIALCAFAWFIASHDSLLCALLNCLKTQLDIAGAAFFTVRQRTMKKLAIPSSHEFLHDDDFPELENALNEELNRCIKHLASLLIARDKLEDIFSYIALFQTLGSILIISSCLFVATLVPITSPIFFSQAEYFFCILLQLWLICNFGNEITFSGNQIVPSVYESDWFSCSKRYKKSLIMVMCRMQRPLYLSIGKFTPLTLITFMSVCRGSFSYLAVFRSI